MSGSQASNKQMWLPSFVANSCPERTVGLGPFLRKKPELLLFLMFLVLPCGLASVHGDGASFCDVLTLSFFSHAIHEKQFARHASPQSWFSSASVS